MRKKKHPQSNVVLDDALIPTLLQETKFFDEWLNETLATIEANGHADWHAIHCMRDGENNEIEVPLTLRISRGSASNSIGWQIALIAGKRIDGFDFETRFCDIHGVEREGFHRHVWNPLSGAATSKLSVTMFNRPGITFRDFLVQAFKHMRISYREDWDDRGKFRF